MRKSKLDLDKLRELHGQGLHDEAIGAQIGCTGMAVFYWRRKLGLAAVGKRGQPQESRKQKIEGRNEREEKTTMGSGPKPRTDIDLIALKADYEGGKSGHDLEEKYRIGRGGVARYARLAGAKIRPHRGAAASGNGSRRRVAVHKLQPRAAIVKLQQSEILRSVQNDSAAHEHSAAGDGATNGQGQAHCRVAMFEVTGSSGEVLAAIEAVKAALQR